MEQFERSVETIFWDEAGTVVDEEKLFREAANLIDPATSFILSSRISEGKNTFHIIFPFITGERSYLKSVVQSMVTRGNDDSVWMVRDPPVAPDILNNLDLGVLSTGFLRGYGQDKMNNDFPANRPFNFRSLVVEGQVLTRRTHPLVAMVNNEELIWNATCVAINPLDWYQKNLPPRDQLAPCFGGRRRDRNEMMVRGAISGLMRREISEDNSVSRRPNTVRQFVPPRRLSEPSVPVPALSSNIPEIIMPTVRSGSARVGDLGELVTVTQYGFRRRPNH